MLAVNLVWWHPVVAGLVGYVLGAIWFSPLLFGKQWMSVNKLKKSEMKKEDMNRAMWIQAVAVLVSAVVLDILTANLGATSYWSGALVGLLGWLGFAATSGLAMVLYGRTPQKAYLLNTTYFAVNFAVMAGILAVL